MSSVVSAAALTAIGCRSADAPADGRDGSTAWIADGAIAIAGEGGDCGADATATRLADRGLCLGVGTGAAAGGCSTAASSVGDAASPADDIVGAPGGGAACSIGIRAGSVADGLASATVSAAAAGAATGASRTSVTEMPDGGVAGALDRKSIRPAASTAPCSASEASAAGADHRRSGRAVKASPV
ncbi:MAG: hypothetical protein JO255_06930 [Alphaproteobacteria bacterium]|nr:hypothetical protein [Alphaproteobacteria bacterium]